MLIASTVTAAL